MYNLQRSVWTSNPTTGLKVSVDAVRLNSAFILANLWATIQTEKDALTVYHAPEDKDAVDSIVMKHLSMSDAIASDTELKREIALLEASVTPRRLRDAVLSDQGKAWLQALEDSIKQLRSKLQ